jgi:hypothetical protein
LLGGELGLGQDPSELSARPDPALREYLGRCHSTVRALTNSWVAISGFERLRSSSPDPLKSSCYDEALRKSTTSAANSAWCWNKNPWAESG